VENVLTGVLFDERDEKHTYLSQRREDLVLKSIYDFASGEAIETV